MTKDKQMGDRLPPDIDAEDPPYCEDCEHSENCPLDRGLDCPEQEKVDRAAYAEWKAGEHRDDVNKGLSTKEKIKLIQEALSKAEDEFEQHKAANYPNTLEESSGAFKSTDLMAYQYGTFLDFYNEIKRVILIDYQEDWEEEITDEMELLEIKEED